MMYYAQSFRGRGASFQDRGTYDANADDPAMDAQYREYRELLEADPEWHDGEIETDASN